MKCSRLCVTNGHFYCFSVLECHERGDYCRHRKAECLFFTISRYLRQSLIQEVWRSLPLVTRDLSVLMEYSQTLLCGTYTFVHQDAPDSEGLSTHNEVNNTDNDWLVSFLLRIYKE